jgi:hypothetical protein
MVEPRLVPDLAGFGISRPKISIRSAGLVLVGGQIGMCLVRLYGSPTVVVWSKGMYIGRAKTARGAGGFPGKPYLGLLQSGDCSRFGRYFWWSSKGQYRLCNACG